MMPTPKLLKAFREIDAATKETNLAAIAARYGFNILELLAAYDDYEQIKERTAAALKGMTMADIIGDYPL
jgi:hypothetical protein